MQEPRRLHGVGDIDEFYVETVLLFEPVSKSNDAKSLSGGMASGDIVHAVFSGLFLYPFGGLTGDIRVETSGNGLVVLSLCGASHDANG